jgi:CheY-like chemotaxis protein
MIPKFGLPSAFPEPVPAAKPFLFSAHFTGGHSQNFGLARPLQNYRKAMKAGEDMNPGTFVFSESSPRILLGSDNQHLISAVSNALLKAGFNVETANDYTHLETLWRQSRHDVVLLEISRPDSVESATRLALRIKQQDPQQFIGYLVDVSLQMSGLTGDAILSRDTSKLPQALRAALEAELNGKF